MFKRFGNRIFAASKLAFRIVIAPILVDLISLLTINLLVTGIVILLTSFSNLAWTANENPWTRPLLRFDDLELSVRAILSYFIVLWSAVVLGLSLTLRTIGLVLRNERSED